MKSSSPSRLTGPLNPALTAKPRPLAPPVKDTLKVKTKALEGSVGYLLRRAQLSTYQTFCAMMDDYKVRPIHYAVLVLIHTNPGLSQVALASTLGIRKANFVPVLDALDKRGFTERRKAPVDRRAAAIYLTEAGDSFTQQLEAAHRRLEKTIRTRLGPRKTNDLLLLLQEFCEAETIE